MSTSEALRLSGGASKVQRALVLFKPDGIRHLSRTTLLLCQKLAGRGINFRILEPTLSSVSPEFAWALYVEEGDRFDIHRRYMSSGYGDPRIVSAPIIAMVIEAEARPGLDLIGTLRANDVVGPTNIERVLKAASQDISAEVQQSIRYQMTLGDGASIWPFPKIPGDPMYNRIHCSASAAEAEREIRVMYPEAPGADQARVQLVTISGDPRAVETLQGVFSPFNYRNFGLQECVRLVYECNRTIPLLLELEGHYFANLDQPHLAPFAFGRFTANPIVNAYVIAICGDTGSGKSTLVRALMDTGYEELVLSTSRKRRGQEREGEAYYFMTEAQMVDALAQGEFAGVDRVGSNFYGIRQDQLHPSQTEGRRLVFAAGPNTIAGVRASLPEGVKFGSIFVDCSPETLIRRIIARGEDAEGEIAARRERVAGTRKRYAPRLPEFDLIISNDTDGDAARTSIVGQTMRFAQSIEAGAVDRSHAVHSAYRMTPQRRLVQYLFEAVILPKLRELRQSRPAGNIDALESAARQAMEQPLRLFFGELMKQEKGKPFLTLADDKEIDELIPHYIHYIASDLQLSQSPEVVASIPRRFGRLWHFGSQDEAVSTFREIQAIRRRIPDDEADFLIAGHDIGKVVAYFNHPDISHRLATAYNLPEFLGHLSAEQRELDLIAIKFHQNFPDCFYSFCSWEVGVMEMFQNPEIRGYLRNENGSVNLARLENLILRLKFMAACDTAGSRSASGGLRKLNTRLYFDNMDRIYQILQEHSNNYEEALASLAEAGKTAGRSFLPVMLFCFDPEGDIRPGGLDYHWNLIVASKEKAIGEGRFSEADWQTMLADYARINTKYSPTLWWAYFSETQTDASLHPGTVPPSGFSHFFVLADKIAREQVPGFPQGKSLQIWFFDSRGREVANSDKEKASAVEMHRIFKGVAGYTVHDGHIYFTDAGGRVIDDLILDISISGNVATLKITHANFSFYL